MRAGIVKKAEDYTWSSAALHLGLGDDKLIRSDTVWGSAVEDWYEELVIEQDDSVVEMIRTRTRTGVPCGSEEFLAKVSEMCGCSFVRRPKGRLKKETQK